MKRLFYNAQKHRVTLASMLLWAGILMIVGWQLPRVITYFTASTQYMNVVSPVSVDPKRYAGDESVRILTRLTTKTPVNADIIVQLIHVGEHPANEVKDAVPATGNLGQGLTTEFKHIHMQRTYEDVYFPPTTDGGETALGQLRLPCNIEVGTYFYQGIIKFEVNDVEKELPWYTEKFEVYEDKSCEE